MPKKCSSISGRLKITMEEDHKCSVCVRGVRAKNEDKKEIMLGQGGLVCVDKFCHLSDMV